MMTQSRESKQVTCTAQVMLLHGPNTSSTPGLNTSHAQASDR